MAGNEERRRPCDDLTDPLAPEDLPPPPLDDCTVLAEPWEPDGGPEASCEAEVPPDDEPPSPEAQPPPVDPDPGEEEPWPEERCTDLGNARRLVRAHGRDFRHCPDLGNKVSWLMWVVRRWEPDVKLEIDRRAKTVPGMIRRDAMRAQRLGHEKLSDDLFKHADRSENERGRRDMLLSARSEPGIAVVAGELDRDPRLFNVENGTLDLRTGRLRRHARRDLITKIAPVVYRPEAQAPTWLAFLDRIFPGDPEMVAFLQRLAGYVLEGGNPEQVFVFFQGPGANGKSTFVEVIRAILGDYVASAPTQVFTDHNDGSVARSAAVADLAGARLVTLAELREGQTLDEALVKSVTGGEPIKCCFKFGPWFEYQPQFTPWLSTNPLPRVLGTDDGIWRRLLLVQFNECIPKREQDPELVKKLRREGAGIFAWVVEGHRQWREQGLNPPRAVLEATAAWRGEEDTVGTFVAECCECSPSASVENGALYEAYVLWCREHHHKPVGTQKFKPRLEDLGFEQKRGAQRYWPGLAVLPAANGAHFNA